jgi:hypothetical protein
VNKWKFRRLWAQDYLRYEWRGINPIGIKVVCPKFTLGEAIDFALKSAEGYRPDMGDVVIRAARQGRGMA